MRRQWISGILIATAACAVLIGAGASLAAWRTELGRTGASIVTGDLALVEGGTAAWRETTPSVAPTERASGVGLDTLSDFRGVPGDEVEVTFPVATTLAGDNLRGEINTVLTEAPDRLPAGVEPAGYRVVTADGEPLAPSSGRAPLGEPVLLDAPGTQQLSIIVTLRWTHPELTYVTDVAAFDSRPANPSTLPILISLEQRR